MQLKLLWKLQEVDIAISDLNKKIEEAPLLSGVEETTARVDQLKEERMEQENNLQEDQKMLKQLEMKTQKIIDDSKEMSDSLYGGKVTNIKELEQMQRRLDQLTAEKQKTEDSIIMLMEKVEEQEEALSEKSSELKDVEEDLNERQERLASDLEQYKLEIGRLEEERGRLVADLEPPYLDKYDLLAAKHQGRLMAQVIGDLCSGCRVSISSGLRGHLYNPGAMVYCENCGRLLVRLEDQQ